ncbi:hypothetical protein [Streptomyces spirodelae]|uniref:Uncharacterized protein n=1 Tax=Streptomyces spirodelae TaxID=2812904 RepID=A0ABS3WTC3_9ACTN|nr:hypothetical protein [Streptomyces spirodelae]MBO8186373.1 hypothetical protein [Streptomyces spirodelae]
MGGAGDGGVLEGEGTLDVFGAVVDRSGGAVGVFDDFEEGEVELVPGVVGEAVPDCGDGRVVVTELVHPVKIVRSGGAA